MKERDLKCLCCGTSVESFLSGCPECGGCEFESEPVESDSCAGKNALEDGLVRMSRHVNPLSPA